MRIASIKIFAHASLALLASGCMSDESRRGEGLTDGAGNAMAANTAMQMVDSWKRGVEETRLLVPAARDQAKGSAVNEIAGGPPAGSGN